jgi:hypothetical protein
VTDILHALDFKLIGYYMKVKDLIRKLSKFPPDVDVKMPQDSSFDEGNGYFCNFREYVDVKKVAIEEGHCYIFHD